jgi:hypothetical protein
MNILCKILYLMSPGDWRDRIFIMKIYQPKQYEFNSFIKVTPCSGQSQFNFCLFKIFIFPDLIKSFLVT